MIVVGIDMAFANVGLVAADVGVAEIQILGMLLVTTQASGHKDVRHSSEELRRAIEIKQALAGFCQRYAPSVAIAEVPSGSQSAGAARALGIAVGVLASCPVPIIEVSPREVKKATSTPTGSKAEIIAWAMQRWPQAPWLTRALKGKTVPTAANEHLADACAAIVAGMQSSTFKLILSTHHGSPSSDYQRPASHSSAEGCLQMETLPVVARRVRVRAG